MPHHTELIATIAVGLLAAFVGGMLAMRLPLIVGYLLAGVVVGPFTPGFVADAELAPQLAEIGVILLMFGVGMHVSIGDLLAVRRLALPGAVGQVAVATVLGAGLSQIGEFSFILADLRRGLDLLPEEGCDLILAARFERRAARVARAATR